MASVNICISNDFSVFYSKPSTQYRSYVLCCHSKRCFFRLWSISGFKVYSLSYTNFIRNEPVHENRVVITSLNREGTGEPAHLHSLVRALLAHTIYGTRECFRQRVRSLVVLTGCASTFKWARSTRLRPIFVMKQLEYPPEGLYVVLMPNNDPEWQSFLSTPNSHSSCFISLSVLSFDSFACLCQIKFPYH